MKKHFIILGPAGLIFYSWTFLILFIGLVICFEGMEKINWPGTVIIIIFFAILIYSLFASYYTKKILKLPYRTKLTLTSQPSEIWHWKKLLIEEVKTENYQKYYLFRIIKTPKKESA